MLTEKRGTRVGEETAAEVGYLGMESEAMERLKKARSRGGRVTRLPMLVELFYGFAIANGLAGSMKCVIEKESLFRWLFLIIAFLLAVGDWLGYHMHVSNIPYRSLSRLLLDLLFPVLIYCLLLAPTFSPMADGSRYVGGIVSAYFAIALGYGFLLRREDPEVDSHLLRVLWFTAGLSATAVSASFLIEPGRWRSVGVDFLSTLAVSIWALYNLRLVSRTMRSNDAGGVTLREGHEGL